jgi:hypothetical protein
MSEISSGKTLDRAQLIQNFASCAAGLLVAADIMSLRVPFYLFGQASDRVGDVFHSVARLIRDGVPNIFDKLETGTITVWDLLYLALTVVLLGAGIVFLRRAWRALALMRPSHWLGVPRLGWRGKMIAVLAFGGTIALVHQFGGLLSLARGLVDTLWLAVEAVFAHRDAVWQVLLAIHESKETIEQVVKGILAAVATYVTLKVVWVGVDFVRSIIGFALPIMLPAVRSGYNAYKYVRRLSRFELTPRKIDWLHGAGSLTAGSIVGFDILTYPSFPIWLWVASVPGLFVFSGTRPNLFRSLWRTVRCVGRYLNQCVSTARQYARSHPRVTRNVAACGMVAVAGVGAFHAYSPLLAIVVLSGTLKAAYSAVTIALMIAAVRGSVTMAGNVGRFGCAVVRCSDATRQKCFRSIVLIVQRASLIRRQPAPIGANG